jgi:hypothetical protein
MEGLSQKLSGSRLLDANSARAIYKRLVDADNASSRNRSIVDAMFNGAPPYSEAQLRDTGQGDRTNLNFNEADSIRQQALAGYYDLVSSVNEMVALQTSFGPVEKRTEWMMIVAEEFSRTLREWPGFEYFYQRLVAEFVDHGVGFVYFPDDVDWRPASAGLKDLKLPRSTPASEECIEIAACRVPVLLHKLFAVIEDADAATSAGWNVAGVRKLILAKLNGDNNTLENKFRDWEALEAEFKNNDIFYGHAKTTEIELIHYWVKEKDGSITHAITDKDGETNEFLFRRVSRFESIHKCLIAFTYGIGNGYYHGIRGLGYKILPHIQVSNQLRCAAVDGAILSSAVMVQPVDQSARALEDLSLTYYGPWALFPPGLKVVERTVPNFSNSILPVINDLSMQLQNNTASYQSRAVTPDSQARTAYEVRAQLQKEAVLTASAVNLFYGPFGRVLREIMCRFKSETYRQTDPGGVEVFAFRRRIKERGVPLEALYNISRVEPVRSIGFGSASMRMVALDEAMQLAPSMDEIGRQNLIRDRLAARFGYEAVDRYIPKPEGSPRAPVDKKIAELENQAMANGRPVTVIPGENHYIHANEVLNLLADTLGGVQQGQLPPEQALAVFQVALPHAQEHVAKLATDPIYGQEAGRMAQALQQLSAAAIRIRDEFQAQMENQQKAEQAEMQRQAEAQQAYVAELEQRAQLSPEAASKLQAIQTKIELDKAKAATDMEIRRAKAAQDMAIRDAKEAAQIISKNKQPAMGAVQAPATEQGMKS